MTRNDWIWLAIRVTGLFFLAKAILAIPSVAASGLYIWVAGSVRMVFADIGLDNTEKAMHEMAIQSFVDTCVSFVCYSIAGYYFAFKGKFVRKLIRIPEEPNQTSASE